MKVDPKTGAPVPALSGEDLTAAVPTVEDSEGLRYHVCSGGAERDHCTYPIISAVSAET